MVLKNGGYIYPDIRTPEQNQLAGEFAEQAGFLQMAPGKVPDRVIFAELETKRFGKPLPRIQQISGSCVGAGGAMAYARAQVGDKDPVVKHVYPWATYGVGREIAGMNRQGEGSFGAAQAKACQPEHFGYLPFDDPRVPQPTNENGWLKWTNSTEIKWSHPSGWPLKKSELKQTSSLYGIHKVVQTKSLDDWVALLSSGYCLTVACMFGTRQPRVQGDILVADWDTKWAHQWVISGFWQHSSGLVFLGDNQWNDVHGVCPTLDEWGVRGSFWIREKTAQKIQDSRNSEIFGHSATGDFEERDIDWSVGTYEDEEEFPAGTI